MITYESNGIRKVFQLQGSVFPQALWISVPSGVLAGLLTVAIYDLELLGRGFDPEAFVMKNNAIWGGFNFLVGFLVVFRTSQAYSRFWEGCTATHKMGAKWFDACSALIAFCKHAPADKRDDVRRFQQILVRLFSMLHAAALGDIEDCCESDDVLEAYKMELIDAHGIDDQSHITIMECDSKVELIFQWIQGLIVENINIGVLTIPPPILTRSFQELGNGLEAFYDALKISNVPFPFPYAQTCDCMLLMHWLMVPLIVCQWMETWYLAAVFAFIQVFTLWTLNLIAVELENPFGSDPNDIDTLQMQVTMNIHLRLLIEACTQRTPVLATPNPDYDALAMNVTRPEGELSFHDLWAEIAARHMARTARRRTTVARRSVAVSRRSQSPSSPVSRVLMSKCHNQPHPRQTGSVYSCQSSATGTPIGAAAGYVLHDSLPESPSALDKPPSLESSPRPVGIDALAEVRKLLPQLPLTNLSPSQALGRSPPGRSPLFRSSPRRPDTNLKQNAVIIWDSTPRGAPRLVETVMENGLRFHCEEPPEMREVITRTLVSPDYYIRHAAGDVDGVIPECEILSTPRESLFRESFASPRGPLRSPPRSRSSGARYSNAL